MLKPNTNNIFKKKKTKFSSNSLPFLPKTFSKVNTNSTFENDFLRILSRVHGTIERFLLNNFIKKFLNY